MRLQCGFDRPSVLIDCVSRTQRFCIVFAVVSVSFRQHLRISGDARRSSRVIGPVGSLLLGGRSVRRFVRFVVFREHFSVFFSSFSFVTSRGCSADSSSALALNSGSSSGLTGVSASVSGSVPEVLGRRAFSRRFRAEVFGLLARAGFLGIAGLATLLGSGSARAGLCVIETPDPSGCARHDDMLYRSKEGIPDEAYVDFVARYCDFEDRIVRTKYAVACVYYGKKAVYQGAEAKLERNYNAIYAPLLVDSVGWTQDANGFFWRVVETVGREPLRPGDRVRGLERRCEHDEDGKETLAKDFVAVGDPRPLEADDVLFVVTKEPWNGMVIEVVGPTKHAFVRVEKVGSNKK